MISIMNRGQITAILNNSFINESEKIDKMKNLYNEHRETFVKYMYPEITKLLTVYEQSSKMLNYYLMNNKIFIRPGKNNFYKTNDVNTLDLRSDRILYNVFATNKGRFMKAQTIDQIFINGIKDFYIFLTFYKELSNIVYNESIDLSVETNFIKITNYVIRQYNTLNTLDILHSMFSYVYIEVKKHNTMLNKTRISESFNHCMSNENLNWEYIKEVKEETNVNDVSNEDDNDEKEEGKGFFRKTIERIKLIPSMINTLKNKTKMFMTDRTDMIFHNKHSQKYESYLNEYGSTQIEENIMLGDPVQLLKTEVSNYVLELAKGLAIIYEELNKIEVKFSNSEDPSPLLPEIDKYCSAAPKKNKYGKDLDEKDYKTRIVLATRAKVAEVLVKNRSNPIYGFTKESMELGKLPPPNILIVSLIVKNYQNKPEMQAISDIFDDYHSFDIISNSEKSKIFMVNEMSSALLRNKMDSASINAIQEKQRQRMRTGIKADKVKVDKELVKIHKDITRGLNSSIKLMGNMKVYTAKSFNVYFDMVIRIRDLVKRSIIAMNNKEKETIDQSFSNKLGGGASNTKNFADKRLDRIKEKEQQGE